MSHEETRRGRVPRRGDVKKQIASNIANSIAVLLSKARSRSASPATIPLQVQENVWPADPASSSLLSPLLVKNQLRPFEDGRASSSVDLPR